MVSLADVGKMLGINIKFKMTARNFWVVMKQCHESSDDYDSKRDPQRKDFFYVVTINACDRVQILFEIANFFVLCSDSNINTFYAYSC